MSARRRSAPLALALALALAPPAGGQAHHRVTLVVPEVELLAVSSGEVTLVFEAPPPGQPFADAVDRSATYAITVNTAGNKITGALDAAYSDGLHLGVELTPPAGATGQGDVELGPDARDLVLDVASIGEVGLPMTYRASVGASALRGARRETRTVTYTITDQ